MWHAPSEDGKNATPRHSAPFVVRLPAHGRFTCDAFVGPTFAFNILAKSEVKTEFAQFTDDIGTFVKAFDLGAAVGAGIEIQMSRMSVTFDARFSPGLTSFVDQADFKVDVKNRGLGFMAGLVFPLGHSAD